MVNRILLVDDTPSNLIVFEEILRELDVICIKALSAFEAIEALSKNEISLILLDVQMPEIDGFETLKTIRENPLWHGIPIIFISAVHKTDKFQIKGIELGALDFIVKPIIPELLLAKIKTFLELYDYRRNQDLKLDSLSLKLEMTEIIKNENLLLSATNAIFQNINKYSTEKDITEYILGLLQRVTQCELSFITKINESGEPDKIIWGKNQSTNTSNIIDIGQIIIKQIKSKGLLSNIIKDNQSIIDNNLYDAKSSDHKQPFAIKSFLGVPLNHNKKTYGIIILVNKQEGFSSRDFKNIEILSSIVSEATIRKKVELELESYKHDLEKMVNERTHELKIKNRQLKIEKRERRAAIDIINSSPAIAFRWKNINDMKLEYVSENVEEISGYTIDELLNDEVKIYDIVHPDDMYNVKTELISFIKDIDNISFSHAPYRIIKKNGEILWVDERIIFNRNKQGYITEFNGIIVNITDRIEAELELAHSVEALKESEELFKTLSDASFESVFLSSEGKCIMQNQKAEESFGYTLSEAIGQLGTNWIIREDREVVLKNMMSGNSETYCVTALRKDGTTFPCEIKGNMSYYKGKPIRITSLTDISERVETQKKLVESEKQYRSLIQDNLSIIMVFDPISGRIIEVNNACCRFYGYEREYMLKMSIYEINTLDKDDINTEIHNVLENKRNYFVFKHKLANGDIRDVEIYSGKIRYGDSEKLLSVIHDITDKVKTSKELIIAKERAEESDRLKTAFLANMSHEIRTPMNAILGFSQLLTIPDIDKDDTKSYLDTISSSGKQLLGLIDDIISISQIEAGIIEIKNENISIIKLLKKVFKIFEIQASEKGLKYTYKYSLPPQFININTDSKRIQQILINLLNNAFKFTSEGEIKIGCLLVNNTIEFYVSDSGIGIKKSDEDIIFERFMQVHHDNEIIYGGTGIGLSITKAIVEKLGGKIWIHQKKTKGSEFRFCIPANNKIPEKVIVKNNKYSTPPNYKDKTILIAEDEYNNFNLLKILLKQTNAKVIWARNGDEALRLLKKEKGIDIILMDIKMPVKNGIDATKEIRSVNSLIPIIAQTAHALEGDRIKAIIAGCNDYIAKPIQKFNLFETLNKYLKLKTK